MTVKYKTIDEIIEKNDVEYVEFTKFFNQTYVVFKATGREYAIEAERVVLIKQ